MAVNVNGKDYDSVSMSVYDRVGHRTSRQHEGQAPIVHHYNGINTDGIRYVKSLYGYVDGRRVLIDRY